MNYWSKVVFTDECKVHASQFRIRFVRRYAGEELGEEYCRKESKYEGQKGVLVWAAITYDGPAAIKMIEDKLDSDDYLDILKKEVHNIKGLQEGW